MNRCLLAVALLVVLPAAVSAQPKPPPPPKVPVYVFTAIDPSGFVTAEEQWRAYTVAVLTERLTKDSKTVRVVTTREAGTVLVEITRLSQREEANSPGGLTRKPNYRYATLTAGAYTTEISERTKEYYAKGLAQALDTWVQLNLVRLTPP